MYEKFSPRVEQVVRIARQIAGDSEQEYLGTEHLLLGILREGSGVGAKMLSSFGIDEPRVAAEVEKLVRTSLEDTWVFGSLPGSPHLKSVVATAIQHAQQMDSGEVCTEHLLLAMFAEKGSVAERVLRVLGLSYDSARAKAVELASPAS